MTVTVLAFIGTIIISLLLPTYYKATTTFYAASEDLSKPIPVGEIDRNIKYYGTDTDINRLLTIANSGDIKADLIEEFGLYEHYDLAPDSKKAQHKINLLFSKLYKINKTKLDALELSVEDKDPELAARIANAARDKINDRAQRTVKNSQLKQLENYNNKISENDQLLKNIGDSLTALKKKYNVFDLETQTQVLLEQLSFARSNGKIKLANSIESQIQNYNKGYSAVATMFAEHETFSTQLSIDKEKQRQLMSSYSSPFNSLHIIELAKTPLIKSRPKRSIYVIGATLFAFFLSTLAALVIDASSDIAWNEVLK